jgi:hypothetical protein
LYGAVGLTARTRIDACGFRASVANLKTERYEDNIKTDLEKTGGESVGFIQVAEGRERCRALVNMAMNSQLP